MTVAAELPMEIINNIMEIAIDTLDPQSVSSITLLSHQFRVMVNKERFFHLNFDSDTSWNELHGLATLFEQAAGIAIRGIQTFIASIYIRIEDDCDYDEIQPHITIFKHLFRHDAILHTPIRKLSLYITNVAGLLSVDPALDYSLRSLLSESHVNFLELCQSWEIPYDLLHRSKIEHLSLLCVGGLSKHFVTRNLNPVNLKSLTISLYDGSQFKITDLMTLLGALESSCFSYMTSLTISTSFVHFARKLLELTQCLETLTIKCAEELYQNIRLLDVVDHHLHGPDYGLVESGALLQEAVAWDERLSSLVRGKAKHPVVHINIHIHRRFMETQYHSPIWKDCWRQHFLNAFSTCRTSMKHFFLSIDTTSKAYD
ncbi:hypothetical protein JR316_0009440 [Psilocybe cubensis]|uniref:Uncharacterized protein n=1 Tax=Psilocybe cubensis TaxID=181762 RepID=A0ACB8GUE2_PSICU|nr:hypothetical protein JR316_0009440 [Psilocybe cubensis]KAH9478977.1 hypothetical protein JR316_0009440 [Psilocybe cubensis]